VTQAENTPAAVVLLNSVHVQAQPRPWLRYDSEVGGCTAPRNSARRQFDCSSPRSDLSVLSVPVPVCLGTDLANIVNVCERSVWDTSETTLEEARLDCCSTTHARTGVRTWWKIRAGGRSQASELGEDGLKCLLNLMIAH
jgi:hypothetical protein